MNKIAVAIAAGVIALSSIPAQADGYYPRHYNHHHHNGNNNGAAIVGGLIGGMILGGIIANQNRGYDYQEEYYPPRPYGECYSRKYQVWDPYRQMWIVQTRTECY